MRKLLLSLLVSSAFCSTSTVRPNLFGFAPTGDSPFVVMQTDNLDFSFLPAHAHLDSVTVVLNGETISDTLEFSIFPAHITEALSHDYGALEQLVRDHPRDYGCVTQILPGTAVSLNITPLLIAQVDTLVQSNCIIIKSETAGSGVEAILDESEFDLFINWRAE